MSNPTIILNLLTFNVGGIVDSQTMQANAQNGDFGTAWLTGNSAGSGPHRAALRGGTSCLTASRHFSYREASISAGPS